MTSTSRTATLRTYLRTSYAARDFAATLQVGDRVVMPTTSTTNASPARNVAFVVEVVGMSIRCRAERCGSVVWISGGSFVTTEQC
jgi:hypothetical protein